MQNKNHPNKYMHFPLPDEYLKILNTRKEFFVVIVGKDPYPTGATGIPFCKQTWREQTSESSSGKYVLESLGLDLNTAQAIYSKPSGLFYSLACQGIAFLNCSYHFLDCKNITAVYKEYVEQAFEVNGPLLARSNYVLLCGEATALFRFKLLTQSDNVIDLIHPSTQNKKKMDWIDTWKAKGDASELFDLSLHL